MDAPGSDDAGPLVRQAADGPRVGLVVAGSRGDAQPFVALAMQLRALGARPVLLTHAEHEPLAQRFGIDFVALPGDPRDLLATRAGLELLDSRDPWRSLGRLRDLAAEVMSAVLEALESALAGVDLVVFSTLAVAAFHVAEAQGRPAIWGVLQPVTPTSQWPSVLVSPGRDLGPANRASHRLADALAWRMLAPGLQDYRRRVGLPPFSRERAEREVLTLGGWSSLLAPAPPDWPPNVVVTGAWRIPTSEEPELPDEVEEFLAAGAPPVFLGLGSATVAEPREVTRMMLAAARDLGVRVVLSRGWAGLGEEGSAIGEPDVLVVDEVAHSRLFGRCAAVLHHAGAGTTHTALAAGVPQVPVPFWGDQPFWAARVAALGVAPAPVPKRRWSRTRIAQALARATGEPWRRRRALACAQVEGRSDGAAEAAARVLASVDDR